MKTKMYFLLLWCCFTFVVSGQGKTLRLTDTDRSQDIMTLLMRIQPYRIQGDKIFFGGPGSINFPNGALIIIDGVKTSDDVNNLKVIPVSDIATITIYNHPSETAKYTSFADNGIIEIKTIRMFEQEKQTAKELEERKRQRKEERENRKKNKQ